MPAADQLVAPPEDAGAGVIGAGARPPRVGDDAAPASRGRNTGGSAAAEGEGTGECTAGVGGSGGATGVDAAGLITVTAA
ncbi:hypothetical protein QN350_19750, partial [Cryobacterium sp. 10I5]